MDNERTLVAKYRVLQTALNERTRRLWAGTEALAWGRGGIAAVMRVTGLSRNTVVRGVREATGTRPLDVARVRARGAGRKAKAVLEKAGCVVDLTEVVATEVADHPGGLSDILEVVRKAELNVEYMYAFTFRRGNKAILVFRFNDPDAAIAALAAAGVAVIDDVDICSRAE